MKRLTILIFLVLLGFNSCAQKGLDSLISISQNSNKLILVELFPPESDLLVARMLEVGLNNVCADGKCKDRIDSSFVVGEFSVNSTGGKDILDKYGINNFPVFLILDSDGGLITKFGSYSFAMLEPVFDKIYPLFLDSDYSNQLKRVEQNKSSASVAELKGYIMMKDSLKIYDSELVKLFVTKATDSDYDDRIYEYLLRSINFMHHPFEQEALSNIKRNLSFHAIPEYYTGEEYEEHIIRELKEEYRLSIFKSFSYAFRMNDYELIEKLVLDTQNSEFRNESSEAFGKQMNRQYLALKKDSGKLFDALHRSVEDITKEYYQSDSSSNKEEALLYVIVDPKEEFASKLNNAAWSYYEAGGRDIEKLEEVYKWSKKSIELIPENGAFYDTFSHISFELGNIEEAIENEIKAIELSKIMYEGYLDNPQVEELMKGFEDYLKEIQGDN